MKLKNTIITYTLTALCLFSCKDDFLPERESIEEGIPTRITLNLDVQKHMELSRAGDGDNNENKVNNLYVFIFSNGNVAARKFVSEDEIATSPIVLEATSGLKDIYGIANISTDATSTGYDITVEQLQKISSKAELEKLVTSLSEKSVNRSGLFLMSGFAAEKNGQGGNTPIAVNPNPTANNFEIKLRRADSKVLFKVTTENPKPDTWTDFSFQPYEWYVAKLPSQTLLVEKASGDYDEKTAQYFTSMVRPFETVTVQESTGKESTQIYTGGTFSFFMPENRKTHAKEIPANGESGTPLNDTERYALRDKEVQKSGNAGGKDERNFEYANKNSTYVVMTGKLSYKDKSNDVNNPTEVSTFCRFLIHLGGYDKEGNKDFVNNYETIRNTSYTYNVKVKGDNNIEVEVDNGTEKRPGQEGDIIQVERENSFVFDAHNCRAYFEFTRGQIMKMAQNGEGKIRWMIKTPFTTGLEVYESTQKYNELKDYPEVVNGKDYQWVKFAINKWYVRPPIENKYAYYPGDQNYKRGLNQQVNVMYGLAGNTTYKDARLLDVNDLLYLLYKEATNPSSDIFIKKGGTDNENDIVPITAFIDEYYYNENPTTKSTENELWKKFANAPDREMYIPIGDVKYSQDGNSSKISSLIAIRQKSIKTVYDVDKADLQTAWGIENIMEQMTKGLNDGNGNDNSRGTRVTIPTNAVQFAPGRVNRLKSYDLTISYNPYDKHFFMNIHDIVSDGWFLKHTNDMSNKTPFSLVCLTKNRDKNGDLVLQGNEIDWYIPTVEQLSDFYIGEPALDQTAFLYPEDPSLIQGAQNGKWHYATCSTNTNDWTTLRAEEGATFSTAKTSANEQGKYFAVRTVRDLGNTGDKDPTPLITATHIESPKHYIEVDASNMSPLARRDYVAGILPPHDEKSSYNKLYTKFAISTKDTEYPKPELYANSISSVYFTNQLQANQAPNQEMENFKAENYRMPNLREILAMKNILKEDYLQWHKANKVPGLFGEYYRTANYLSKTHPSKDKNKLYILNTSGSTTESRPDGGTYYRIEKSLGIGDKGYIRGVKDLRIR